MIILATLLHHGVAEAADVLCAPVIESKTEYCSLSEVAASGQAIQDVYSLFSTVSPCMEHADSTQVPDSKSTLLLTSLFRLQQPACSPECDRLHFLSPHPVPDTNYYIFGLRKILI